MEDKTKAWLDGCNSGSEMVLEFLKEVKNVDFEEEFNAWSNCDSYTNWKGEKIDKCGDTTYTNNTKCEVKR